MTAVDLGSFSKASEVVGYTQSGLTHGKQPGAGDWISSDHTKSQWHFPDRTGKGAGASYQTVPSGKCQSGKSDSNYYQATDGNHPDCRLCQYGHVLDAGNIVPFSQDLPKSGCRPADGG